MGAHFVTYLRGAIVMELAIYAHPWDLRALSSHGGLARLRDLGFGEVALAASYHAGRWLTPWDPAGLVRFLEDGTVHFRPRADYGMLKPKVSSEVVADAPSPLEWLCDAAKQASLRVRAWAVFTHNTRLGELHPECCVENALGDRYHYALCPSSPHVQQYMHAMLQDLAAHDGLHTIELEAIGWMGWKHSSHHEKASFTPDALTEWLLSLCFCAHCTEGLSEAPRVRQALATSLRVLFAGGDAMEPLSVASQKNGTSFAALLPGPSDPLHEKLGDAELRFLWQHFDRRQRIERFLHEARERVRAGRVGAAPQFALQVHPNEYFHGSQAPNSSRYGMVLGSPHERVVTCYGEGPTGIQKTLAAVTGIAVTGIAGKAIAGGNGTLRLCIHPKAPQFSSEKDLLALRALCDQYGIRAVTIYHLGLLPWRTIERVAAALRT
ncbi:MAG: hypothetical protein NT107_04060 [Planctomycetota bacterium]|nr:hypothetical protein [Planctomycetota bacterium]